MPAGKSHGHFHSLSHYAGGPVGLGCPSSLVTQSPNGLPRKSAPLRATSPEPHSSLVTSEDELNAFKEPIWIRYEDKSGTATERVVEIYRPRDDGYLHVVSSKAAPRTFVRRNILSWRLLEERFDFDPVVPRAADRFLHS
jgi:hypothetical protein